MTLRPIELRTLLLAGLVLAGTPALTQTTAAPPAAPASIRDKQAAPAQQFQPQAPVSTFGGTVVEDVVARVNDQIISRSDYDRAMQQLEADGRQQGWNPQELEDRKRDLLRDLVDQQLLLSKGKEMGITGDAELVRRLDDIRKQNHLDSMEALEKAATQQGVSYEDFKQNIRNSIITQQVVRDEVGRRLQLSQGDLQRYYEAHKSEFGQPESVHLNEILIPVAAGGNPDADLAAAKAKADAVVTKLKAGDSFAALAKSDSAGATAAQGGDLGDFKRGMLAKPLEDATFALSAGQYTEPIRTKQGFIILEVAQHIPGGTPDLKSVQPQVEEAAYMSRMQPALRQFLTQLRQEAYIDYKPGYVDTAATPESIKPLYSAYTPPAPKKKASFQRTRYRAAAHTFRNKSGTSDTAAAGTGITSAPAMQVASKAGVEKPGKKEKIRFGQAPREALPAAPVTPAPIENGDAGSAVANSAAPNATPETQVAANSNSNIAGAGDVPATAPETKTRFSDRARQPKPKKVKTADQIENANVEKISADEIAAQKTQSAPLGLAGDTATPKRQPKVKGDKTRFSDQTKGETKDKTPAQPQSTTPSPLATPQGSPPPATPPSPSAPIQQP